jgi:uncharacterized membrane protein
LFRGKLSGLFLTAMGGGLLYRGMTGRCQCYQAFGINTASRHDATAVPAQQGDKVEQSVTIRRPPHELYRFWRNLENLPRVMQHLKQVETIDNKRSHWIAQGPLGRDVEWDAEIINERENELIAWRSLPDAEMQTAGSVHFQPARQEGATELIVSLKYNPPGGNVGATVASWLGAGMERKLAEDLQNFKHAIESGVFALASPAGSECVGEHRHVSIASNCP